MEVCLEVKEDSWRCYTCALTDRLNQIVGVSTERRHHLFVDDLVESVCICGPDAVIGGLDLNESDEVTAIHVLPELSNFGYPEDLSERLKEFIGETLKVFGDGE